MRVEREPAGLLGPCGELPELPELRPLLPGPPCPRSVQSCARLQCWGPRCLLLLHPCPFLLYPHPVQPCLGPSCPHSLCPV
ncbi:hypothetical protein CesoFtcFv8_004242 [Champsocephalus esox]|uniref:Uncharacterized protein n=1 Tax=Champsocephalus esox TaxID=159716 RepID=A0AAN8CWH4_9TELE|nr:hypothetical protein CesoFtcFv8_004242 [Champsocephalus esox]